MFEKAEGLGQRFIKRSEGQDGVDEAQQLVSDWRVVNVRVSLTNLTPLDKKKCGT